MLPPADIVPAADKASCVSLLNQYGPELLSVIISEIPFDELCSGLNLCAAPPARDAPLATLVAEHAVIRRDDCAICTLVMTVRRPREARALRFFCFAHHRRHDCRLCRCHRTSTRR